MAWSVEVWEEPWKVQMPRSLLNNLVARQSVCLIEQPPFVWLSLHALTVLLFASAVRLP